MGYTPIPKGTFSPVIGNSQSTFGSFGKLGLATVDNFYHNGVSNT